MNFDSQRYRMQVHFLQVLPLPKTTDEVSSYSIGNKDKRWMILEHKCMHTCIQEDESIWRRLCAECSCRHIHASTKRNTSLCVGINFQGIPSATSALNCTTISLAINEKLSGKWGIKIVSINHIRNTFKDVDYFFFLFFFSKLKQNFSLSKWRITKENQQITKHEISEPQTKNTELWTWTQDEKSSLRNL